MLDHEGAAAVEPEAVTATASATYLDGLVRDHRGEFSGIRRVRGPARPGRAEAALVPDTGQADRGAATRPRPPAALSATRRRATAPISRCRGAGAGLTRRRAPAQTGIDPTIRCWSAARRDQAPAPAVPPRALRVAAQQRRGLKTGCAATCGSCSTGRSCGPSSCAGSRASPASTCRCSCRSAALHRARRYSTGVDDPVSERLPAARLRRGRGAGPAGPGAAEAGCSRRSESATVTVTAAPRRTRTPASAASPSLPRAGATATCVAVSCRLLALSKAGLLDPVRVAGQIKGVMVGKGFEADQAATSPKSIAILEWAWQTVGPEGLPHGR